MSYPRWFQVLSGVSRERKGWFIQVEGINHPLKRLFQLSSGQRSSLDPPNPTSSWAGKGWGELPGIPGSAFPWKDIHQDMDYTNILPSPRQQKFLLSLEGDTNPQCHQEGAFCSREKFRVTISAIISNSNIYNNFKSKYLQEFQIKISARVSNSNTCISFKLQHLQ